MRINDVKDEYATFVRDIIEDKFGPGVTIDIKDEHDGIGVNSWKTLYLSWK